MTRIRYAAVALLLVVFAAGCRPSGTKLNQGQVIAAQPGKAQTMIQPQQQPVSSPDIFLSLFRQWTGSLAGLTAEINDSYNQWSNNKIGRPEFLDQLEKIQENLASLKMDADYKDFELNPKDQQRISSTEITRTYYMAEKDVNDFLYYAPHLNDAQLKARYNALILNNYDTSNKELQTLLNPQ
jgi:hypothetical protein